MTVTELVGAFEELRIQLLYSHPCGQGAKMVLIPPSDAVQFVADPVGWLAKHYGVTRAQYLAWHESEYCVRCAGSTSQGRPCRNVVEGGATVSIERWLALQGEYCHVHSCASTRGVDT